jgi:exopolysaccharide production protein ExoZ
MIESPPVENIRLIQCLRGIAALMVAVFHLRTQAERLGMNAPYIDTLQAGVDIFFVISGFIMWVTTAPRPGRSGADFLKDRLVRIAPLYWLITLVVVAMTLLAPAALQTTRFDLVNAICSFLFLPASNPSTGGQYLPILVPGWTLNFEMFFYLIFAAAMFAAPTQLGRRASLIVMPLVLLALLSFWIDVEGPIGFYLNDIVLEFAYGIVIGILFMRGTVKRRPHFHGLIMLGFVALAANELGPHDIPQSISFGIPAAAIVTGAVFATPLRLTALEKLGDWSYSLYLTHPLILSAASQAWRRIWSNGPELLFYVAALVACLVVAAICFHGFERPVTRWLKRTTGPRHERPERIAAGAT